MPAAHYKATGRRPEELYAQAVAEAPKIRELVRNATREGKLSTTKDWSFVSKRLAGENWFLAGESAGFADPILSAGMSLAHVGGRNVAYCILAAERGDYDRAWLAGWYDEEHRASIAQHIRFADFWYSSNGCFTDLIDHTAEIARGAGLDLSPDQAWQWLGTGGFVDANAVGAGHGGYTLRLTRQIAGTFLGTRTRYEAEGKNVFQLDLDGAVPTWGARLENGRILRHRVYRRGDRLLPRANLYGLIMRATKEPCSLRSLVGAFMAHARECALAPEQIEQFLNDAFDALEAMVADGWLRAGHDPDQPGLETPDDDPSVWGPRPVAA